jgi:hypothetical protein
MSGETFLSSHPGGPRVARCVRLLSRLATSTTGSLLRIPELEVAAQRCSHCVASHAEAVNVSSVAEPRRRAGHVLDASSPMEGASPPGDCRPHPFGFPLGGDGGMPGVISAGTNSSAFFFGWSYGSLSHSGKSGRGRGKSCLLRLRRMCISSAPKRAGNVWWNVTQQTQGWAAGHGACDDLPSLWVTFRQVGRRRAPAFPASPCSLFPPGVTATTDSRSVG